MHPAIPSKISSAQLYGNFPNKIITLKVPNFKFLIHLTQTVVLRYIASIRVLCPKSLMKLAK